MSDKKQKVPCRSIDELPFLEDYDPMPLEEKLKLKITDDEYRLMMEVSWKKNGIDMDAILSQYSGKRLPWEWVGTEWKDGDDEAEDEW